jgi:peptidoglycan/LPS O-acetylase OafA/YrhL
MKIYFNGLDGLRAFAAVTVMIAHIIEISGFDTKSIDHLGFNGVIVFYVLSGFLITSLLLIERSNNKKISFKKFYVRRILRIWPLYFLIIGLSLLFFEFHPPLWSLLFCLTIFPNIPHFLGYGWSPSVQIWTIGVEEQFYLFWPFLTNRSNKFLLWFLLIFIPFWTLLPHFIGYLSIKFSLLSKDSLKYTIKFFYGAKFNCMAIGALLALIFVNNKNWLSLIYSNRIFYYIIILFWLIIFYFNFFQIYFTHEILAITTALLMAYIINNKTLLFDNFLTKFLGKISYGIYMYHWMVTSIVIKFYQIYLSVKISNYDLAVIIIVSSLFTIIISFISFNYFEAYFFKLKDKFKV